MACWLIIPIIKIPKPQFFIIPLKQKGEHFSSLVLADGTKVWLNAFSSIHFPIAFMGKERIVDITGEAYFEVVKNASMPFKVIANGMLAEVIGTHFNFNINAYDDEAVIKTTLLEGVVKIAALRKNVMKILNTEKERLIYETLQSIF
jgi:transmembrane sensor